MPLNTEHLTAVSHSLRAVFDSISFEYASPAVASWRAAGVLIHLADEDGSNPTDVAACLAVAHDLLTTASSSASSAEQVALGVILSSTRELLELPKLHAESVPHEMENAMIINLAVLDFGRLEDADARQMAGALGGLIARGNAASLSAAASLIGRKNAPLRSWFEACGKTTAPETRDLREAPRPVSAETDGPDALKSFAKVGASKVALIGKKQRPKVRKAVGDDSSEGATILRSRWKRRSSD